MSEKCSLETEEFPPLSELDHLQKNCFCYLCSCGHHKCPSLNSYQRQSPRLVSSYQQKFSRKQGSPARPFSYINEILSSKQKMDLVSTNKADFKAYNEVISNRKNDSRHRSVSPFRFNASSTYKSNYLDYGPVQQSPTKVVKNDYEPLKFNSSSTYAQNFIRHGKIAENFDKSVKKWNILGYGGPSILESTNNSTYKMPSEILLSKPFIHSSLEQFSESASPHMRTTYESSFFEVPKKVARPTLKQLEKSL